MTHSNYNPKLHHRQSIRLKGHNYAGGGVYFVTLCAHRDAGNVFADESVKEILARTWEETCIQALENGAGEGRTQGAPLRAGLVSAPFHSAPPPPPDLLAYCIMPDHFHGLLRIRKGDKALGDFICAFKSRTTHAYIQGVKSGELPRFEGKIWHRNYYEMIVRSPEAEEKIAQYIQMNPWRCVTPFANGLRGMGNPALWNLPKTGVLCSRNAPRPNAIPAAPAYFGGFHSPMEKQIFERLLEHKRPLIWCPAWGLDRAASDPAVRRALEENRMLILEMSNAEGDLAAARHPRRYARPPFERKESRTGFQPVCRRKELFHRRQAGSLSYFGEPMTHAPKNKIPELRFPEFAGEWVEKRLGDISKWKSGGTPSKEKPEYWDGEISWISASSMHQYEIEESEFKISELGLRSGSRLAEKGTILLLVRGSMLYNRIPLGVAQCDVAFNQDVKAIDAGLDTNIFLLPWFQAKENLLLSMVTGTGIGAGKLETSELKGLTVGMPSLAEQKKIASFLSAVDGRIEGLEKKRDLLKDYKKGLMQKLFNQTLRFTDDNGKPFSDWVEKKLGQVGTFSKGKGLPKDDISEDGKTECIRYGELYTHYNELISTVCSKTNVDASELVLSEENDVIIPASGETQIDIATASCIQREGIAIGGDLNIIRTPNNGVFLAYYLNNKLKHDIARLAQGVSVIHLYPTHLKTLKLLLPKPEEQKRIAECLTELDRKIGQVEMQVSQTRKFKQGLLQKMFV